MLDTSPRALLLPCSSVVSVVEPGPFFESPLNLPIDVTRAGGGEGEKPEAVAVQT